LKTPYFDQEKLCALTKFINKVLTFTVGSDEIFNLFEKYGKYNI